MAKYGSWKASRHAIRPFPPHHPWPACRPARRCRAVAAGRDGASAGAHRARNRRRKRARRAMPRTIPTTATACVGSVDHARNGFDPYAMLTDLDVRQGQPGERPDRPRMGRSSPPTRRSRSRPASSSRPGPTTAACPARRSAASKASGCASISPTAGRTRTRCISTASTRRAWTACPGAGMVQPGEDFTYEFDALPFGCHLYHCHALPLKRHIHKGMYGAFIVDPDPARHPLERRRPRSRAARHAGERAAGRSSSW